MTNLTATDIEDIILREFEKRTLEGMDIYGDNIIITDFRTGLIDISPHGGAVNYTLDMKEDLTEELRKVEIIFSGDYLCRFMMYRAFLVYTFLVVQTLQPALVNHAVCEAALKTAYSNQKLVIDHILRSLGN